MAITTPPYIFSSRQGLASAMNSQEVNGASVLIVGYTISRIARNVWLARRDDGTQVDQAGSITFILDRFFPRR